jgi:hypothetical protein
VKERRGQYRVPSSTTSSSREEESKVSKGIDPFDPYGPFTDNGSQDYKGEGTDAPNSGHHNSPANTNNLDRKGPKGPEGPMCICGQKAQVRVTGEYVAEGLYCDECAEWLEGEGTVIAPLKG